MNPIPEDIVWQTLRQVIDPELGCNIVDLGLVYHIAIEGASVRVVMTLTTRGCPMHESIRDGVQNVLLGLPGVNHAVVEVTWDPPWHSSMMTKVGRATTGL